MFEIILNLFEELHVSTHNIIYLFFGAAISGLISRYHKKVSPILFLYNLSLDLFNSLREYEDQVVQEAYNQCIIRAVCILAHDGVFARRDQDFIFRTISKSTKLSDSQSELICSRMNDYIDQVIAFEEHYNSDGVSLLGRLLHRRASVRRK